MKNQKQLFLTLILLAVLPLGSTLYADSTGKMLEMTLSVRNGTGDDPMIVLWLETDTGGFVQTLHMFSKSDAYYKDMLGWLFKSRKTEKLSDLDAVSGATIRWNRSKTISVPSQLKGHDLLDGTYVLRIESRKDKGKHYRSFKIPLTAGYAGGLHENMGYVKSVEITIIDKAE